MGWAGQPAPNFHWASRLFLKKVQALRDFQIKKYPKISYGTGVRFLSNFVALLTAAIFAIGMGGEDSTLQKENSLLNGIFGITIFTFVALSMSELIT